MALHGRYAELFTLQAAAYTSDSLDRPTEIVTEAGG
jgi:hypothetical protein